jgi:ubiquinone biosynthesis monooxygenase Coq7
MGPDRLLEPLIVAADRALRALLVHAQASRPTPAATSTAELTDAERREAAALMRVNHAGEIAAQALYHGQALAARSSTTRDLLLQAAVAETERQVEGHLDEHLDRLPAQDTRSRAILQAMRADEMHHGSSARAAGAAELPVPIRALMRYTARIMTGTAYWM